MFSLYLIITTLGTKHGSIFTATGSRINLSKYRASNQSLKQLHILNGLIQHFILGYSNSANVYVSLSQAFTLNLGSSGPIMRDSYNKNVWAAIANAECRPFLEDSKGTFPGSWQPSSFWLPTTISIIKLSSCVWPPVHVLGRTDF